MGVPVETQASIDKALDVLFHLHGESAPQGVTAIGRALGLPKSSTHRLLAGLGRRGLVERDSRGRYRTGFALVALGLGALAREPVVAAARPVLESGADEFGETVFLVSARAGRLLVLDKAEGSGFLRAAPRVGAEVPVHATAVGKLFLAFGGGAVAAPRPPLERFTAATPVRPADLEHEIEQARRCGHARNRDEWIPGLSVVAAPILIGDAGNLISDAGNSMEGRMIAAVAVAAATPRLEDLGADRVARRTQQWAGEIAARLQGIEGRPT